MSGHKDSGKNTILSASAQCSSSPPPKSISSHRTCPLEVEVTRATRRHRHVAHHHHTPNHSQGWVIGMLTLFFSYLWMMSTSAAETRFILWIMAFLSCFAQRTAGRQWGSPVGILFMWSSLNFPLRPSTVRPLSGYLAECISTTLSHWVVDRGMRHFVISKLL